VNVSNIFNDIMYWIRVNYNTFQGFHDLTRFLNRIYDCQDHEVLGGTQKLTSVSFKWRASPKKKKKKTN
jgi:hypothetical protein